MNKLTLAAAAVVFMAATSGANAIGGPPHFNNDASASWNGPHQFDNDASAYWNGAPVQSDQTMIEGRAAYVAPSMPPSYEERGIIPTGR